MSKKKCKHEWLPLGNDRWSCKHCAMVKVGYVEELKQQLAEKDKELQKEKDALNWYQQDYAKQMEDLAKELAEKDKEIEKFVKYFELEACLIGRRCDGKIETKLEYIENFCQDIRHQICNEAKKRIVKETCYDAEEEVRNAIYDLNAREVLEILDDIEKGE